MPGLLEKAREHFGPRQARRLEVPEWGSEGQPLVITYFPITLSELATVHELDGTSWQKQAARIVAMKALDAGGRNYFTLGDATALREEAAPDVVNRIALAILSRISIEDAVKN